MSPQFRGLVLLATGVGLAAILWRLLHQGVTLGYLATNAASMLVYALAPVAVVVVAAGWAIIVLFRRR